MCKCNIKVLIIDDDTDFAEATKFLLESQGYQVITAVNGQEGFSRVKQESPDMVLLDMMMNYATEGIDVAQAIAADAASRQIPVIMITGAHKEVNFPIALSPHDSGLPVREVMEKPVKPEELLRVIKKYFGTKEAERTEMRLQLEKFAKKWEGKKGSLVMILHEIQNHFKYVPREVAFELSRLLDVPMTRIYEVITFYSYFKLRPPGKHQISLCMGTACYLKGASQILKELKRVLQVEEGRTTSDGLFHLQVVRCLGCCGLAPVMTIGEKVYSKVKESEVMEILAPYMKEEEVKV